MPARAKVKMDGSMGLLGVAESRERVKILDIYLDCASMTDVLERLQRFIEEETPRQVVTVNVQFLSIARKDPAFARLVNETDLVVADGMPLLWVSRLKGAPVASRITGHTLLDQCASLASERGYSIFLLGGGPGAAEGAAQRLRATYPNLRVEGTDHGYFSAEGEAERQEQLAEMIRKFRPEFLFVGLGCPKQELWIHRHMHDLDVPVCVGVGGTFDVFTERLRRAPAWMQRYSLEWVYRLSQEPGRLWKRYILGDVPTALMAAGEALLQKVSLAGRS